MIDGIDHSYQDYLLSISTGHIRYTEKDGIVLVPVKQYSSNAFAYGFLILIIASFLVAWKK